MEKRPFTRLVKKMKEAESLTEVLKRELFDEQKRSEFRRAKMVQFKDELAEAKKEIVRLRDG